MAAIVATIEITADQRTSSRTRPSSLTSPTGKPGSSLHGRSTRRRGRLDRKPLASARSGPASSTPSKRSSLLVRRQARNQLPRNTQQLKEQLEQPNN
jgi:hypothetical protein